jgi:putative (di)nucleoside polyphosphate hydrolase
MTPDDIAKLPYRPCVGIMLVRDDGKVFTGTRIDAPVESPAWQMPQGGIDEGEDPRDAAFRELGEETGVTPDLVTLIAQTKESVPYELPHALVPNLWKGRYRGQMQKWFLFRFHGTDADIDITTHEQEFSEWKWMDVDTLLGNIVPFKQGVYDKVIAEFRELL